MQKQSTSAPGWERAVRQRREDEGDGGGDQEKVRKGSEEHGPDILMHAMLVGGRHGVTKRARADIAAEKDVTTARSSGYFCRNEQQDQPAPSCDREGSTVEKAVGWQLFPHTLPLLYLLR